MKQHSKKQKKRGRISAVIGILVLLIGLSLLLYPTIADYVNSLNYKNSIDSYQQQVSQLDDSARQELLAEAYAYNAELKARTDHFQTLTAQQRGQYNSLLDPFSTGMMGYIEIEKVNIYLPIYHGTRESVLQAGVGHIEGSSLPVGGVGVHTMLSAHTGLPSAKLFTNIDQLVVGDTFTLHVLGETLTYQVESAVTVLPDKVGTLRIEPDKDICTLMTCTPYGVNTHRLLVRGVRVETPQPDASSANNITDEKIPLPPVLLAVIVVLILAAMILLLRRGKRGKGKNHETSKKD